MSIYDPSGPFDPLAKLIKAERALLAAGARGEPVAEDLKDVRNSIRAIIEQRADRPRERERFR